jgi:hypothetical protein
MEFHEIPWNSMKNLMISWNDFRQGWNSVSVMGTEAALWRRRSRAEFCRRRRSFSTEVEAWRVAARHWALYWATSGVELRFSRHSPDWRVTQNF